MAAGRNTKRNSRIFHIANECYIIYLGIKTDEEKPFLRIGNMANLNSEILDVVSNTVIASRFTGNPLYELEIDKDREVNYIGDTSVIKRMKTYLNSFQLPSNGAVDYHKIKDREQRDVVYFYNNGNIKLNYKEESIFNLYKRSEEDLHYVQQCDDIKKSFSRNPLRYTKHDFKDSGILLSGKSLLFFKNRQFFSTSLSQDYFASLAAAGIDPDQITVHYSSIKEGDEGDDSSFSLIEMLKRSSYRNSPFKVVSNHAEYAKKIGSLFPGAEITKSTDKWKPLFDGFKIRDKGTGLEINCSGFPSDLAVGAMNPSVDKMVVSQMTGNISIIINNETINLAIPDGIPCSIKEKPPQISDMTELYISRFVPLIKGFSDEDDYKVALAIQKLLKLLSPVVDGDGKSGLIMRSSVFNFTDLLKNLKLKNDSILTFFLENAIAILELSLTRAEMEGKIVKNIKSIKNDILSILKKSEKADSLLPVSADIYTEEYPALLYRSVKSTSKKADYILAGNIAKEILSDHDLSTQYYIDEKDRLFKLISMLKSASDLEVDKLLEKNKPTEPVRQRKMEYDDRQGEKSSQKSSDVTEKSIGSRGQKKYSSRKKLPWWLLLLLIPLLLLLLWGGYTGINYFKDRAKIASLNGMVQQEHNDELSGTNSDGLSGTNSDEDGFNQSNQGTIESTSLNSSIENNENNEKNDSELNVKELGAETENRENLPRSIEVETDRRPETMAEVNAYLQLGDFKISEVDVHLVSNQIAVENNYRDLDYEVNDGADPDWIYPGNEILLPDETKHIVKRGDNIWYLAARFIRASLERDIPIYEKSKENLKTDNGQSRIVLEGLLESSPCEAFREKIHEVLRN